MAMSEDEISKSLREAVRLAAIEGTIEKLLPVLQMLPEKKKKLCREIFIKERERRKQLIKDGILREED